MHALIATDGSAVSTDAAKKGLALLKPDQLTLLTVADTSVADDSGAGGMEGNLLTPEESDAARKSILKASTADLDEAVSALDLDPAKIDSRIVEGSSGQMIIHVADEVNADVIVVGSHGHGFLSRVLIGSVSEYVVRHTQRPVMVIRHDSE